MISQPPVRAIHSRVSMDPIIPTAQKSPATELRDIMAIVRELTIPAQPNQRGTTPVRTNREPNAIKARGSVIIKPTKIADSIMKPSGWALLVMLAFAEALNMSLDSPTIRSKAIPEMPETTYSTPVNNNPRVPKTANALW